MLDRVPPDVTTWTRPVVAPVGTVALISEPDSTVNVAAMQRLVANAIALLEQEDVRRLSLAERIERPTILDVGVGSGAIALALKDERPDAQVTGVDESEAALGLARENAERLHLDVELRLAGLESASEGWDLVVSNPPYVQSLAGAQPELRFEPEIALVGSGLHEHLAERARTRALVLEVGDGQAAEVATALEYLGYRDVRVTPDLAGIDRVVEGVR